jgi:nucleotide-binding universal stress UspA family protein
VRIVIATTGALRPDPVAQFARRLVGPDGMVFVVTVIEVPRSFLDEIRADHWHPLSDGTAAWATEEDAIIARYVEERGGRLTEPLIAALEANGVDTKVMFLEGEDPAGTIITAAEDIGADLIVMGATKALFDETHWESVSARVLREARLPVLVIPAGPLAEDPDEQ